MKTFKGIGLFLFLIAALALGRTMGKDAVDKGSSNYGNSASNDALISATLKVAKQLNAQLPMQIDEITVLQNVMAFGPELTYYYVLDMKPADAEGSELVNGLKPNVIVGACSNPDMRKMLSQGAKYTYNYRAIDNKFVGAFTITNSDC